MQTTIQYWTPSKECKEYADIIMLAAKTCGNDIYFDCNVGNNTFLIEKILDAKIFSTERLCTFGWGKEAKIGSMPLHEWAGMHNTKLMHDLIEAISKYMSTNENDFNRFWQRLILANPPFEINNDYDLKIQKIIIKEMIDTMRGVINRDDNLYIRPGQLTVDDYFRRTITFKITDTSIKIDDPAKENETEKPQQITFDYNFGKYVSKVEGIKLNKYQQDMVELVEQSLNKYRVAASKLEFRGTISYTMSPPVRVGELELK